MQVIEWFLGLLAWGCAAFVVFTAGGLFGAWLEDHTRNSGESD